MRVEEIFFKGLLKINIYAHRRYKKNEGNSLEAPAFRRRHIRVS